ncbi:Hypothetical predicted protein [Podarcis lilfordi]|nr:Hypothetical predicted protein [Podarcis lilfordi]
MPAVSFLVALCLETIDDATLFVDRGCVGTCIHLRRDAHYRNLTWCCQTNYCNMENIWPHDVPSELIIT